MSIQGLAHSCVVVSNLDKAVSFYKDVLGMEVLLPPTDSFEGEELSASVGVQNAKLRLAFLKIGESLIELVEFQNPVSEAPALPYAPTATLFGLGVTNLEQTRQELESKGVKFLSPINIVHEAMVPILKASKWVRFNTPDGGQIELIELA
ncbi:VOC family protein [Paenibacillus sp. GSMTC-2017]|uniref:VOC family protein n=1 Tax=Paenibacillus sp. GSMTC-2017 TaxID=2794350 RepID=UPI0018D7F766|nr:VOC family protein [Paenibacillus sp. GSMTC-2017]MBH5320450.1 VOC family protein [Paenibacillus sp. GSMTC-2017]